MEQRYHPSKYTTKRNSSVPLKKEGIEVAQSIVSKKIPDYNLFSEFKIKGKGNINPQILKTNYSKGTPFFKNDKASEYSAKTKAKTNKSSKSLDSKEPVKTVKTVKTVDASNVFAYPP